MRSKNASSQRSSATSSRTCERRSWTAARRREALMKLCRSDLAAERLLERLFRDHPALLQRTRHLLEQTPGRDSGQRPGAS
jgi:hypothetical protein